MAPLRVVVPEVTAKPPPPEMAPDPDPEILPATEILPDVLKISEPLSLTAPGAKPGTTIYLER